MGSNIYDNNNKLTMVKITKITHCDCQPNTVNMYNQGMGGVNSFEVCTIYVFVPETGTGYYLRFI